VLQAAAWPHCASSLGELAEGGFEASHRGGRGPAARARVLRDTQSAYDDVITGDLRTVPIPQRLRRCLLRVPA